MNCCDIEFFLRRYNKCPFLVELIIVNLHIFIVKLLVCAHSSFNSKIAALKFLRTI